MKADAFVHTAFVGNLDFEAVLFEQEPCGRNPILMVVGWPDSITPMSSTMGLQLMVCARQQTTLVVEARVVEIAFCSHWVRVSR
jgi:hypothetical protein